MSCLNSGRRRSASSGVSPVGWKSQNRPWWTQHELRAELDRALAQLAAGADRGHDLGDLLRARDLQAVRAEVAEVAGGEQLVERTNDVRDLRHSV